MLNLASIQGRLVRDPEKRTTQSGVSCTTFTVAVDRDVAKDGVRESDFFSVVAWRTTADFITSHFKKGDQIIVDGRLSTRKWTDKDGNNRTSVEIIADRVYFCGSKRNRADDVDAASVSEELTDIDDDGDLPF